MSLRSSVVSQTLSTPRVLIADDQSSVSDALAFLLKVKGIQADIASQPAEVLTRLKTNRYDLLLMDMNYEQDTTSGAEGLRLVDAVRNIDPALGIVVMTAWSTVEIAVAALQRGAADFIQKPWDNDNAARVICEQIAATNHRRQERAIALAEQEHARQVQDSLMGAACIAHGRFSIAAESRSSRIVGGDFYDVMALDPHRMMVCIADAMGKGVGAAMMMSNFQAHYRSAIAASLPPEKIADALNHRIHDASSGGRLMTAFIGLLDDAEGTFTFTSAGHPPAILLRQNGECESLSTQDAVLGGVIDWSYRRKTARLTAGDCLVLVTDGVLEAADSEGQEVDQERLEGWIRQAAASSAAGVKEQLLDRLLQFSAGPLADDATVMVIKFE